MQQDCLHYSDIRQLDLGKNKQIRNPVSINISVFDIFVESYYMLSGYAMGCFIPEFINILTTVFL